MSFDWAILALIAAVMFSVVQIFMTYRRQIGLIQPAVEQLETSREKIETMIKESDETTEEIQMNIINLAKELETLEMTRSQLHEKVCKNEMVQVPAGDFLMGDDEGGATDEYPEHSVLLNAFLIDKYPVTNAQYKMFIDITGHRAPPLNGWGEPMRLTRPNVRLRMSPGTTPMLIASGSTNACLPRPSGRKPRGEKKGRFPLGECLQEGQHQL